MERRKSLFLRNSVDEILSSEYFKERFKEEKNRAERSEQPFSLIIIDFNHSINGNGLWKFLNGRLTKGICNAVLESTRCTDLKGWYESDRIVILLPDTDTPGVNYLAERLQVKLESVLEKYLRFEDLIKDKIILTSLTYPDNIEDRSLKDEKGDNSHALKSREMRTIRYLDQESYHKTIGKNSMKWTMGMFSPNPYPGIIELNPILIPLIISSDAKSSLSQGIKRVMDIFGSLLGILLCSPLMLVCAVLIKITSPGPILFKQERVGYMGKRFTFIKFRSMYKDVDQKKHESYVSDFIEGKLNEDTEEKSLPIYKLLDDPRITPLGRFLRRASLDELPQLFNVLIGDMSLVGPRPAVSYEINKYKLWHKKRVMGVKPGITGLWQVSGRCSTTFEDMVRLDLYYANNWTLNMDIMILFKTVKAVLSMKGAY